MTSINTRAVRARSSIGARALASALKSTEEHRAIDPFDTWNSLRSYPRRGHVDAHDLATG